MVRSIGVYIEIVYLSQYHTYPALQIGAQVLAVPNGMLLTAFVSALDAYNVPRKYQLALVLILLIFDLSLASYYSLCIYHNGDFTQFTIGPYFAASLLSICVSINRTMAIFWAKQALKTWMRIRKSSNKAITIMYAPCIEWKEDAPKRRQKRRSSIQIDPRSQRLSLESNSHLKTNGMNKRIHCLK